MVTKKEPPAPTRSRRRPARKKAANSKIAEAQKAAQDKQKPNQSPAGEGSLAGPVKKLQAGKPVPPSPNPSQTTYSGGPNYQGGPPKTTSQNDPGPSMFAAAKKIAGLASPVVAQMQAKAKLDAQNNPMAQTNLYGGSTKDRAARISAAQTAANEAAATQLKAKGQAVWMGPTPVKQRTKVVGDMPDAPGADTTLTTNAETIVTKNALMAWLSDPAKVDQIMKAAQAAGLNVTTYDDAQKLWASVVDQAGDSYSLAGKKVTPFALIQLRGKYAVNGKTPDKITTSTNIDEMDPASARLMFEKTAQDALGRAPTKSEVDDFIAKAQTIAKANPVTTVTRQSVGFDGKADTENSTSTTTGQGAAAAQSQLAAMDQAKQSEDYAAYQAAGNYFPMLFQALQAPV